MGEVAEAALRLVEARQRRQQLVGLGTATPDDLDEAYAIQRATLGGIITLAGGGQVAGYKIGCTNPTAQAEIGIDHPFHGALLSPWLYASPAAVAADGFFMTVLEPEIAFRMGADLPAGQAPFDRDLIAAAVAEVLPAIEIVDSRYQDWTTAGALLAIADNGFNGGWVHGRPVAGADLLTLDEVPVEIAVNGTKKADGVGGNALGHPLNALTWLAHELARRGTGLQAGDYVSTGTCTATVRVEAGDRAVAGFGRLGQVEVTFT